MKKAQAWFYRWLIVQIVAIILLVSLQPLTAVQADGEADYLVSNISDVQIDSIDSSLWVLWYEHSAATNQLSGVHLSHFSLQGQLLRRYDLPLLGTFKIGLVEQAGVARYYIGETIPVTSGTYITQVGYLDLADGQYHQLPMEDKLKNCQLDYQGMVYKNDPDQLYIACADTLILKATTGEYLGSTTYIPLAPRTTGSNEFYALQTIINHNAPPNASDNEGYQSPYYELVKISRSFDPASVQVIEKVIGEKPYNFAINNKTNMLYVSSVSAGTKAYIKSVYSFNAEGTANQKLIEDISSLSGVNETTNQIYGTVYQPGIIQNQYAIDANDTTLQKASFLWTPLVIDQKNNLMYATYSYDLDHEGGLSLLVMNGTTFSLARFIQIREPDNISARPLEMFELPDNFHGQFFPQTGHSLSGKFLDYWNNNGGLARFGYPITEVFEEYDAQTNTTHQVQYFERNRFELHPENAGTKYEVLLGLLSHNFSALTGPRITGSFISGETAPAPGGGLLFKETGHTLSGKFLDYWNQTGGLAQHGLPLTEPTNEVNPIDGKTYLVQYFERSRLELHPENAGTQYEVLMGLLGTQALRSRGWSV